MNNVFENFVTELIGEVIRENWAFDRYTALDQWPFTTLDIDGKLKIIPDIIIEDNDSDAAYPLVLDTKYKRQDQNSDYYQIIAYALAIPSARNCCLLYPKDTICEDNLIVSRNLLKPGRNINIFVRGIDLFIDEDIEFKEYIQKMKDQIEGILLDLLETETIGCSS